MFHITFFLWLCYFLINTLSKDYQKENFLPREGVLTLSHKRDNELLCQRIITFLGCKLRIIIFSKTCPIYSCTYINYKLNNIFLTQALKKKLNCPESGNNCKKFLLTIGIRNVIRCRKHIWQDGPSPFKGCGMHLSLRETVDKQPKLWIANPPAMNKSKEIPRNNLRQLKWLILL